MHAFGVPFFLEVVFHFFIVHTFLCAAQKSMNNEKMENYL